MSAEQSESDDASRLTDDSAYHLNTLVSDGDTENDDYDYDDEFDEMNPKSLNEVDESKLIGVKAWGRRASAYYNHDLQDFDMMQNDVDAQAVAILEEKETEALRTRLNGTQSESDFIYINNLILSQEEQNSDMNTTFTLKDFNLLNVHQRMIKIKSIYPTLMKLIYIRNKLVSEAQKLQVITNHSGGDDYTRFFHSKLLLIRETILLIYFAMLVYRTEVNSGENTLSIDLFWNDHPVFAKLASHLQLLKKMDLMKLNNVSQTLLQPKPNGYIQTVETQPSPDKKPVHWNPLDYYNTLKTKISGNTLQNDTNLAHNHIMIEPQLDDNADCGRKITKEMEKNRGLVKRSKREYKNPRVKHRIKYKRAVRRHVGKIAPIRQKTAKYGGEKRGINAKLVHSVKFK